MRTKHWLCCIALAYDGVAVVGVPWIRVCTVFLVQANRMPGRAFSLPAAEKLSNIARQLQRRKEYDGVTRRFAV